MTAGFVSPGTVRKAAAFVEKLDELLDTFGVRLDDDTAIAFSLILPSDEYRPTFAVRTHNTADQSMPTGLTMSVPQ